MLQFLLNTQRLNIGLNAVSGHSLQTSVNCNDFFYYLDGYDLFSVRGYSKSRIRVSHTEELPVAICLESGMSSLGGVSALFEDGVTLFNGSMRKASGKDIDKFLCRG
jgi:hypothetical protein